MAFHFTNGGKRLALVEHGSEKHYLEPGESVVISILNGLELKLPRVYALNNEL